MAIEKSRFFDSIGGDRKYSADQFAEYFRVLITDGILNGGDNLRVAPTGGAMSVIVKYGIGMVQGYMYWLAPDQNVNAFSLPIAAGAAQPRIDRVVLRLDKSNAERRVYLVVKTGVPGATPLVPELEREGNIYELSLARITVRTNATTVLETDIVDERYSATTCGLMSSLFALDGSVWQSQAEQILATLSTQGYVPLTNVSATPQVGKLLQVNDQNKLPADITGDAATVDGKEPKDIIKLLAPDISEIRLTRGTPAATTNTVLWIVY